MAGTPDPKLHAIWRDRVRRQEASGLTLAKFCAQEGVARPRLHAWKRRFRLMERADGAIHFSSCKNVGGPQRPSPDSRSAGIPTSATASG